VERRWLSLLVTVVMLALGSPAGAEPAEPAPAQTTDGGGPWSPPVDGPVVRGYEPPQRPFGRQHLGLDYAVPPGTPVRAAGDGTVVFAGLVGRSRAVAIEHPGGRRTTYTYLRRVLVRPGAPVHRGDVLGRSGTAGPRHGPGVVHFGYRVNGHYEDPAVLFPASPSRISLAPLDRPACPSRRGPERNRWR
jgi:murein DD-endopeptidase MepM/ murein hydrolase activator NlpD